MHDFSCGQVETSIPNLGPIVDMCLVDMDRQVRHVLGVPLTHAQPEPGIA